MTWRPRHWEVSAADKMDSDDPLESAEGHLCFIDHPEFNPTNVTEAVFEKLIEELRSLRKRVSDLEAEVAQGGGREI